MNIDGAGESAALTGPFDDEVWGGTYDGVYLVKACALDKVAHYAQYYGDGSTCTDPPTIPPPFSPPSSPSLPPPPSAPPPNDVCSEGNMVAGCKCASQGLFNHGRPDNPSSTSPLCCDKATRRTVKGAQITSYATCVKYSPPPRPPPPLPPPPSPPPSNWCSKDNLLEGCVRCGIIVGTNCPQPATGLCCHKDTKVVVKGALSATSGWCARTVSAPTLRRLLAAPAPPSHTAAAGITGGTSPMDLYALRAACEAMDNCIGFKMQSTGCVHWIMGEDTSSCAAASRRTPDPLFTPPGPLWTQPESGAGVDGEGEEVDEDIMAHAGDAAPSSAVHTSEVTIGVVATITYSSPTLAVSLRGEFYYQTCDEYQARLVGKVEIMPVGGSSDPVIIFTVGATMGCLDEKEGSREYRVFGTVPDFAVISGVTVRNAVANATIVSYLNGDVALNGTFAGAAVIDGDVEGLEGFDLSDSSLTVTVEFAKRPHGQLKLTRVKLFVELDIKYYHADFSAASLGSPHETPVAGSVQRFQRRHAMLGASTVEETIPSTGVANVHVWGSANFTYPCAAGERQQFAAHVSLRFDPFHVTGIFTTVTYFCQQTGPVLPAFTFTASVASDMKLGPTLVVSAMNVLINGYNMGNGTSGKALSERYMPRDPPLIDPRLSFDELNDTCRVTHHL